MARKHSKRKIIIIISAAMIAEAVFLLWPLYTVTSDRNFVSAIPLAIIGLFSGLASGLLYGLGYGLVEGLVYGFVGGLVFGLLYGLVSGLLYGLDSGLVFGLALGLLYGLESGLGLGGGLVLGLVFGLVSGLVYGLVVGLSIGLRSGLVSGLGGGFGIFASVSCGSLVGISLKKCASGASEAIKGFFKPWESVNPSFWSAIAFFLVLYIFVILLFSLWYYALYLEGIRVLPSNKLYFEMKKIDGTANWWDFCYFSFVTITTTGYGDITPKRFLPQLFVFIETLSGIGLIAGYLGIVLQASGRKKRELKEKESEDIAK